MCQTRSKTLKPIFINSGSFWLSDKEKPRGAISWLIRHTGFFFARSFIIAMMFFCVFEKQTGSSWSLTQNPTCLRLEFFSFYACGSWRNKGRVFKRFDSLPSAKHLTHLRPPSASCRQPGHLRLAHFVPQFVFVQSSIFPSGTLRFCDAESQEWRFLSRFGRLRGHQMAVKSVTGV